AERRGAEEVLARRYAKSSGSRAPAFAAVVSSSGRVVHADPSGWLESPVRVLRGAAVWPQEDGSEVEVEPLEDGYLVWRAGGDRPPTDQVSITFCGRARAAVTTSGEPQEMNLRHSEILALLALHPEGMTVRDLALALYGTTATGGTVRAEVTRLRRRLGPGMVLSRPYRLHGRVVTDLGSGAGLGLLPESRAPGIAAARCSLDAAFQVD
ncbi:MAG: helix-turn-helix domain-containing protein, partial [Actinobacteria bacterium]|nr:helix-turn-helix domain-containing protein [Actinomycetota bacterium]